MFAIVYQDPTIQCVLANAPRSLSLSFPYPSTEKVEFHEGETYHPTVSIHDGAKRAANPLGRRLALSAEQLKKKRYARREDAVLSTGRVIDASKTDWSIDTPARQLLQKH